MGGAPPLRSIADATVPHYLPLCNTISHFSVRPTGHTRARAAFLGSATGETGGGEQWGESPERARFRLQTGRLNAILRADRPSGGSPAPSRNRAAIGSSDITDGSIRNRDFKDGTLRGNEARRNGFGGGAIKESTLDKVDNAAVADGLSRHAVVSAAGAVARNRGATSATRTGEGQYQVVFDADVAGCTTSRRSGTWPQARLRRARSRSAPRQATPTA